MAGVSCGTQPRCIGNMEETETIKSNKHCFALVSLSYLLLQKYGNAVDTRAVLQISHYSNVLLMFSVKGITGYTHLLFY